MVPLLLSILTAPPVLTDASGAWLVDGAPLAQSCATLRSAGAVVVETIAGREWSGVEPALAEARDCGVESVELHAGTDAPVSLSFARGDEPVVFIGSDTHIVYEGAAAPVDLQSQAATVWRAFPSTTRPRLAVALTVRARAVATQAGWLLRAADRPARVCLLLEKDLGALPATDRVVIEVLRGGEAGAPGDRSASGHLTRWFSQSSIPQAEEREVPRWTRASSLVCANGGTSEMWGIGSVTGIRNHALARMTADNRARAEIAKLIQVHVSRSGNATKTFTAQTLSGVQIVDHFMAGKTTWALASVRADKHASQPCPSGSETIREWTWRKLDPNGGFGTEKPQWAQHGVRADAERVWVTTSAPPRRPLAESEALLETLARSQLSEALARGALTAPSRRRTDTGEDCLVTIPWAQVAADAPVETWYAVDGGALYARASVALAELRHALGPGCSDDLVQILVTRARQAPVASAATFAGQPVDYPEWVRRGTRVTGQGADRVFFGVGSVSGIKNHALARTTADNRARAEIAKLFEVFTATLMRDYMRTTPAGDEEQHVGMAIKTFSAQTLSGVQVVDHWIHPDGTVYALAQLDLETFESNLGRMRQLNDEVRDYVRKNAERVHRELEKEE